MKYMAIKPVNTHIPLTEIEENTLKYWKENKIFEKSVENRPIDKNWTFLDGPPFITGMPHYGTLLPSILKDIFPRYWTMKGYRVRRVWGWDCHGLPAENKVESKLGIKRKKDIEEVVGVKKFIEECKSYVNEVSSEWQWYIDHIARWVDFEHAYKTMDTNYMESVMWVFKQMYDRGHIYKGLRVSLFCPHCSTPISNFEVAMDPDNYKEISEPSNTYMYELKDEPNTYLLAWSTTPWNKVATPALAVNPELTYIKVKQEGKFYILAESTIKMLKNIQYEVVDTFLGKQLINKEFVPHYNFYTIEPGKKAFIVIPGSFVTAEEGTGIVTIAAYGEEDLAAMKEHNIQIVLHVDEEGHFKSNVPKWASMYYLDANPLINADLSQRGLLYDEQEISHTVPTCWRCHTRLFYAPQNAWYVNVQDLKPLLLKTNEEVNWFPDHFKFGRFANSMKAAPDWCISRSRYWGSPVPVWECDCGWRFVPGSIEELSKKSGQKIYDLHKPDIDEVHVVCDGCGKKVSRVPEVLDSWIEAGSASFAERHYPFDQSQKLEDFFPPDFIVEYTGQIRAWFYVLHVIAAAIFGKKAFKNVAVTGVIMGTDGKKMSKNLGNYPDPRTVISKYGGDALRLYLAGNPVTRGEDMSISEDDYKLQLRSTLLILWNSFNFVATYASIDKPRMSDVPTISHPLDKWIVVLTKTLTRDVATSLELYDTPTAVEKIKKFIDELSTWYIRRSRDRVGPSTTDESDKNNFYSTAIWVFKQLCLTAAPITPFITDEIYRNITDSESVHLESFPDLQETSELEKQLIEDMKYIRKVIELGLAQRKTAAVKVRQPLKGISYTGRQIPEELLQLVKDELNVKEVYFEKVSEELEVKLNTEMNEELIAEGEVRELIRQIQELRKSQNAKLDQQIKLTVPKIPSGELLSELQRHTLATEVREAEMLSIELL